MKDQIPEGFRTNPSDVGLMKTLGPYYINQQTEPWTYAFYADERHFNPVGALHGGALVSFIDNCMGQSIFMRLNEANATISMTNDFIASVMKPTWVFGKIEVVRETRSIIFMRGEAFTDEKLLMSSSGVFKRIGK